MWKCGNVSSLSLSSNSGSVEMIFSWFNLITEIVEESKRGNMELKNYDDNFVDDNQE